MSEPSSSSSSRIAGPIVFSALVLIVAAVGGSIWLFSKTPKPETKPSVSEPMAPGDWSWADEPADREPADGEQDGGVHADGQDGGVKAEGEGPATRDG
jgi:flagellar basal body-associated protein FliL